MVTTCFTSLIGLLYRIMVVRFKIAKLETKLDSGTAAASSWLVVVFVFQKGMRGGMRSSTA